MNTRRIEAAHEDTDSPEQVPSKAAWRKVLTEAGVTLTKHESTDGD